MAPKAASTALSEREVELLRAMHRCLKSKPEIDMEKFKTMTGFSNVNSARANINRLLSKLSNDPGVSGEASEGDEAVQDAPATGKKKADGRKRKTNSDDEEMDESPAKKKASPTKRKGKKAIKEEVEDEDA